MKKSKQISVNLGCGTHLEKGYINIDNYELSGDPSFIKADIRDLPLESNSVDYIICDQVLEHVAMADIPVVLFNIRRVLKKGGRCVIIVPDFEDAARQWLAQDFNKTYNPMQYQWFSEVIYGNQEHEGEFHKTAMSARFLHEALRMAGLAKNNITFWPANGKIPDFPGMRPYNKSGHLRNAQLVCDIVKT